MEEKRAPKNAKIKRNAVFSVLTKIDSEEMYTLHTAHRSQLVPLKESFHLIAIFFSFFF